MTLPLFNVGGLVSGLDSNSIVQQLIQIERIPINQLAARKSDYQAKTSAWDAIATRVSALRDAAGGLDNASDWRQFATVSSSDDTAVSAAVTGGPSAGATSFTVNRLATRHQVAANGAFGSAEDLVGAGTLSITSGGQTYDVTTTASTTVSDLIGQINASGAAVSASLLNVTGTSSRLVIGADDTGAAGAFTVTADQTAIGTFATVETGVDAELQVGTGVGAITITRASNTVDDLIDGVSLQLKTVSSGPVTVTVNSDNDAAVTAAQTLVDELNATMSTIDSYTKYDPDKQIGGPLAGDASARSLELDIRSSMSDVVAGLGSSYTFSGSVGISLTQTGTFTFDEAKFRAALDNDLSGVRDLFVRTGTTTDTRVVFTTSLHGAADGTHAVSITQAADRAAITGSAYTPPAADEVFTITSGAAVASVTIPTGSDIATAVSTITTALNAAGITTITAADSGGAISLAESRYGASTGFTVSANGLGLAGGFNGTDVAGTIGGLSATGSGRSLTGTGDLDGLVLSIRASQADVTAAGGTLALGTVTVTSGLAASLDEFLEGVEATDGLIDRARDRWTSQIDLIDDRIADMEDRLDRREETLRRQYTALESAMARLTAMSTALASQLGSLSNGG